MTSNSNHSEIEPFAFLNGSRSYCDAANFLMEAKADLRRSYDPIYMLYFHAAELALKAFLRFKGVSTKEVKKLKHHLGKLYSTAKEMGLVVDTLDSIELENVVSLLYSGNREEGFRYFTYSSRNMPDIEWTRVVVNSLVEGIQRETNWESQPLGRAVKLDLIIGPPTDRAAVGS